MKPNAPFLFLLLIAAALLFLQAGCSSTPRIPPGEAKLLLNRWELYRKHSPDWPDAKAEWVALGENERMCLIDLLLLDIKANAARPRMDSFGNPEPGWIRPAEELKSLGRIVVPPMLQRIKKMKDETVVIPYTEVLAHTAVFEDLNGFFENEGPGEHVLCQRRVVRVLSKMDDPRSLDLIMMILHGAYEWEVRASAADVLGSYRGPRRTDVVQALKIACDDKDVSVAYIAKKSLGFLLTDQ